MQARGEFHAQIPSLPKATHSDMIVTLGLGWQRQVDSLGSLGSTLAYLMNSMTARDPDSKEKVYSA